MFGIDDPFIILPYLLSVVCVIFAAWFGLKYWNNYARSGFYRMAHLP